MHTTPKRPILSYREAAYFVLSNITSAKLSLRFLCFSAHNHLLFCKNQPFLRTSLNLILLGRILEQVHPQIFRLLPSNIHCVPTLKVFSYNYIMYEVKYLIHLGKSFQEALF